MSASPDSWYPYFRARQEDLEEPDHPPQAHRRPVPGGGLLRGDHGGGTNRPAARRSGRGGAGQREAGRDGTRRRGRARRREVGPHLRGVRVVLDTGVVLSSLIFPAGRLAWLPGSWKSRAVTPLASSDTTRELIRALGYPKFRLSRDEVSILLGEYLPWTEIVQ